MNRKGIAVGIALITLIIAGWTFYNERSGNKNEKEEIIVNTNQNALSMKTENLTREMFLEKVFNYEKGQDWKYEGDLPCIIDFYADWCGPCKMVAPILEELAAEYDGKIKIYKVDTEAEQELASVFGIRSIPSILFVPKEGQPQMAMGALPKSTFKKAIDEVLLAEQPTEAK